MSRNERFNNKKNAESRDCEDHDSHRRDQATNGNDTLIGTGHSDSILGRRGDDHIKGKGGNDLLFGQNGNDTINGGAGRDLLDGGNGSDTLRGGSGNDVLLGGAGADTLRGGTGNDLLFGGQGDDILRGGVGHDFLSGGTGNDILRGGADSDVVDGGRGDDSLIYAVADNLGASDTYSGGKGNDTLVLKLTSAEWFDPQVQADIASFLDFLEPDCERHGGRRHHSGHGGEALGQFHFTTFDLTVSQIENLRVFVDGTEVSLQDDFIIANPDAATLSEDASATEFSSVLDNDAGSDLAYSVQLVDGPVAGNLTFNAGEPGTPDGSFSFDPAGAFEHLAEGESEDVSFTYEVQDASGNTAQSTVTVTVTGTNDVPVITSSAQSGAVAEDGTLTATGQVTASDADNGAVLAFSGDATGSHGGFAINAGTGAWTYTLDNGAAQSLAEGETVTETFTVTVTDEHGATTTQDVTVTVTGTNDVPIISGDDAASVRKDNGLDANGMLNASGALTIADADTGEVGFVAQSGTAGLYGTFTIDANGNWSYSADNDHTGIQALGADETLTETFAVTSLDGTENAVTITINTNVIQGTSGNDTLPGTNGNDIIIGLNGADYVYGQDGNDIIYGGGGADYLRGYADDDTIFGGDGGDRLTGDAGNDILHGGSGGDEIRGGTGNDILYGDGEGSGQYGSGSDELYGDTGDDLLFADQYDTIMNGGADTDTLSFEGSGGQFTIDLDTGEALYGGTLFGRVYNVENVIGGDGNDLIAGDANDNVLEGGDGNDSLYGRQGADELIGGAGEDYLYGGNGADVLTGGDDSDTFVFSSGVDTITDFDSASDFLDFSPQIDLVSFDELMSHATIGGSGGHITMTVTNSAGTTAGRFLFENLTVGVDDIWDYVNEDNTIFDPVRVEEIDVGEADEDGSSVTIDLLDVPTNPDYAGLLSANNISVVDTNNNSIAFVENGDGTISIDTTQLSYLVAGETLGIAVSYDIYNGTTNMGSNTATLNINGQSTAASLLASAIDDAAYADATQRFVLPNDGDFNGEGDHHIVDQIERAAGSGNASLTLSASDLFNDPDSPLGGLSINAVYSVTYDSNGTIQYDDVTSSTSISLSGNVLSTGAGLAQGYYLVALNTEDTVQPGLDSDDAYVFVNVTGEQSGGSGGNTLNGTDYDDGIEGRGGNDTINGYGGNDTLNGNGDNDTINGGAGNDTIAGGDNIDLLNGGEGDDVIDGGNGKDTLMGGAGDDFLTGGNGADEFFFFAQDGEDTITDFDRNDSDMIYLSRDLVGSGTTAADVVNNATLTATGVDLTFDDGTIIHLEGLGSGYSSWLADHIDIFNLSI